MLASLMKSDAQYQLRKFQRSIIISQSHINEYLTVTDTISLLLWIAILSTID